MRAALICMPICSWLFSVLGLPLSALYLHRLLTQDSPQDPQDTDAAIELSGRNTSRPPSVTGKEGQPHEAYPMEKLSSLHYGTSPNAATMSRFLGHCQSAGTAHATSRIPAGVLFQLCSSSSSDRRHAGQSHAIDTLSQSPSSPSQSRSFPL